MTPSSVGLMVGGKNVSSGNPVPVTLGGGGGAAAVTDAAVEAALGAPADAVAGSDTANVSMISLIKRWLTKIPVVGQALSAASLPVVIASDQSAVPVSHTALTNLTNVTNAAKTNVVVSGLDATFIGAPAVTTGSAYTSGNCIGNLMVLTNAAAVNGGAVFLHALQLVDRSNQKPAGYLVIFNANPSGSTLTDKTAASITAADALKVASVVPINASDWVTIGTQAFSSTLVGLGRKVKNNEATTTLYAAFVTTSTPTFANAADWQVTFKFVPINA